MRSVWDEIANPKWIANVGLPLIVTLAAILIAYLILKAQQKHDLEIMRAERRIAAAQAYGLVIVEVIKDIDSRDYDSDWWCHARWPGYETIRNARGTAHLHLPQNQVIDEIFNGARDMMWAWHACQLRRKELIVDGRQLNPSRVGASLYAALEKISMSMKLAAGQLILWDGVNPLPRLSLETPHIPLRSRKKPEKKKAWMGFYADLFEKGLKLPEQ